MNPDISRESLNNRNFLSCTSPIYPNILPATCWEPLDLPDHIWTQYVIEALPFLNSSDHANNEKIHGSLCCKKLMKIGAETELRPVKEIPLVFDRTLDSILTLHYTGTKDSENTSIPESSMEISEPGIFCEDQDNFAFKDEPKVKPRKLKRKPLDPAPYVSCQYCGKFYSSRRRASYQKHLALHFSDYERVLQKSLCQAPGFIGTKEHFDLYFGFTIRK